MPDENGVWRSISNVCFCNISSVLCAICGPVLSCKRIGSLLLADLAVLIASSRSFHPNGLCARLLKLEILALMKP